MTSFSPRAIAMKSAVGDTDTQHSCSQENEFSFPDFPLSWPPFSNSSSSSLHPQSASSQLADSAPTKNIDALCTYKKTGHTYISNTKPPEKCGGGGGVEVVSGQFSEVNLKFSKSSPELKFPWGGGGGGGW